MQRSATAVWDGDLKTGKGTLSTQSGVLKQHAYDFNSRFEDGRNTNPEELIAAAHAGCFTMALAAELGKAGITPKRLQTDAKLTLDRIDGKPTVVGIALSLRAEVPGADKAVVAATAEGARSGCVISRLLSAPITLTTDIVV